MSQRTAAKLQLPQRLVPHFLTGFPLQTWMIHVRHAHSSVLPPALTQLLTGKSSKTRPATISAVNADGSLFDWIGENLVLPESTERLPQRPTCLGDNSVKSTVPAVEAQAPELANDGRADGILHELAARGFGEASTPQLAVGVRVRRIFRDGGYYGSVV